MSDRLHISDELKNTDSKPIFKKTKIIGGYDAYKDEKGMTRFGKVVFETSNMIVLGGGIFTLEKIFDTKAKLQLDYLDNILEGNTANSITTYAENNVTDEMVLNDSSVCLFGVGTGGSGDSINSVIDVKYTENNIIDLIPLRQSTTPLSQADSSKYWFKSSSTDASGNNETKYFLKTFESQEIKTLWDDSGDSNIDGSEVSTSSLNTSSSTPISNFVELTLKIDKNDIREYFSSNVENARINSIGLFYGIKVKDTAGNEDYRKVRLFSKLNINNEIMDEGKELTIVYRIYTS